MSHSLKLLLILERINVFLSVKNIMCLYFLHFFIGC